MTTTSPSARFADNSFVLTTDGRVGIIRRAGESSWTTYEIHALPGVNREDYFVPAPVTPGTVVAVLDVEAVFNFWVLFAQYLVETGSHFAICTAPVEAGSSSAIAKPQWIDNGKMYLRSFEHVCHMAMIPRDRRIILAWRLLRIKLDAED